MEDNRNVFNKKAYEKMVQEYTERKNEYIMEIENLNIEISKYNILKNIHLNLFYTPESQELKIFNDKISEKIKEIDEKKKQLKYNNSILEDLIDRKNEFYK